MIDNFIFDFFSKILGLNAMCTILDDYVDYCKLIHHLQNKVKLTNITLDEFYKTYKKLKQENLIW